MHVLWTPSWYPSPDQPLNGSFFAEQVRMLREAAMEVGVLALDPHSFWQGRPGSVEIDEADRLLRRSVPVLPKGIFPGDQALTGYYAGPLARAYEQRYGRPDLIHAHSVFPGLLLARALAARWGVPYGLTEHRPSSLTRNRRYPRFGAIAKALKEARFRLTVSAGMARQASDFYGLDFDVLSLPVSAEFTQVEPTRGADGTFVFLHVSMLDRNKRPAETIAAFARVHKKHPATRLLIAGGKADRIGELRKVAGRAGVADSVTFLGEIARCDVPTLMANADCHVLFSAQEAAGVVFSGGACGGHAVDRLGHSWRQFPDLPGYRRRGADRRRRGARCGHGRDDRGESRRQIRSPTCARRRALHCRCAGICAPHAQDLPGGCRKSLRSVTFCRPLSKVADSCSIMKTGSEKSEE
ncbi:glycosyltransferase [Trueperella pyogenes]|uniref:glycosyltransferase n=1 Tax=Trueperella pyogenes TaxID=1661 RepID=UPI003DA91567